MPALERQIQEFRKRGAAYREWVNLLENLILEIERHERIQADFIRKIDQQLETCAVLSTEVPKLKDYEQGKIDALNWARTAHLGDALCLKEN